jgi:hypothetical protein
LQKIDWEAAMSDDVASFAEFWPHYLAAHRDPRTRAMHYLGLTIALACVVLAVARGEPWFLAAALAAGYGFAIPSHYIFEGNRPATFGGHVLWSACGDFKMYGLWLSGRLGPELARIAV